MRRRLNSTRSSGYLLPGVFIMSLATFILVVAGLQIIELNYRQASDGVFNNAARAAAKAGLDYAQEKFDIDPNYSGSTATKANCTSANAAEKELVAAKTPLYCAVFSVSVSLTSGEGTEKSIQSTGIVYIGNRQYSKTSVSEIVRTNEAFTDPLTYNPEVWYDANDANANGGPRRVTTSATVTATPSFTVSSNNESQFLNERQSDGVVSGTAWGDPWFCLGGPCVRQANPAQYQLGDSSAALGGLLAANPIPVADRATAVVTSATIQFRAGPADSTALGIMIQVLPASSTPSADSWAPPFTANQLRNANAPHNKSFFWSAIPAWTAGAAGAAQRTPELAAGVQFVKNSNYIAFKFQKYTGSATAKRIAQKGQATLSITYQRTARATNTQNVNYWFNKIGSGAPLLAPAGREPVVVTTDAPNAVPFNDRRTINGLPSIRFPYAAGKTGGNPGGVVGTSSTGNESDYKSGKYMYSSMSSLARNNGGTLFMVMRNSPYSASPNNIIGNNPNSFSGIGASLHTIFSIPNNSENAVFNFMQRGQRDTAITPGYTENDIMFSQRIPEGSKGGPEIARVLDPDPSVFRWTDYNDAHKPRVITSRTAYSNDIGGMFMLNGFRRNSWFFADNRGPTPIGGNYQIFAIGTNAADGNNNAVFDGYVSEVIYYNDTLTCLQMDRVSDYLMRRWDIPRDGSPACSEAVR